MDYTDSLREAEGMLKAAEKKFLDGAQGIADGLLVEISTGPFVPDADLARERMQDLDESKYIKWDRWMPVPEFSPPFWKNEGYPSVDATTHQARNPEWYSKRTGTSTFVGDILAHRETIAPTIDGKREGTPTAKGQPANRWLLDFVVFSSLRLSFKTHWEQLVKDIVRKRNKTSLLLIAERLGLEPHEVLEISQKIRDFDDQVVEQSFQDHSLNMTYFCRKPDPSIEPIVDIVEPSE